MATSGLREELNCSICLNPYTEPISLKCGHNVCRGCIVTVLDTQASGICPECREDYPLEKKRKLCNVVDNLTTSLQEDTEWMGPVSVCPAGWLETTKGHHVELLNEAFEKLKDVTGKLSSEIQTEKRIQNLENHRTQDKGKAADVIGRVTELFGDIRKQLDGVEKRILADISRQEEQILLKVSDLIHQLEEQKDELSRKINQMEELCNIQDPLTVLKKAPNRDDMRPKTGDTNSDASNVGCLVDGIISQMLQRGLCSFHQSLKNLMTKEQFSVLEKSNILLDIDTAHDNLIISKKRNRATHIDNGVNKPDGPKRFKCCQVLNKYSFTSGTHYWEVDVREAGEWMIGVASESMERKIVGKESYIGFNDKSWSLSQRASILQVRHKNIVRNIDSKSLLKTVGIHLDYEAGRLSYYQLCGPVRHLHTFTFTEPLYPAFYMFPKSSIRIIK
ncbi:PREDICTED: E3 ubiquitin/ISG15 ligase TRIM25-like [Nanorana parkeri]|uniref:E3 ubiquitin/ISG15 ligase TRIM25-like n=1 Tax=Nanorana parkeri TaxID=125878 RepID=UPI0008543ED2|nr:PREDICTED: E3 ubiquitin/ISG15 ligase TRIM25-like [Nanorana parkeri]